MTKAIVAHWIASPINGHMIQRFSTFSSPKLRSRNEFRRLFQGYAIEHHTPSLMEPEAVSLIRLAQHTCVS